MQPGLPTDSDSFKRFDFPAVSQETPKISEVKTASISEKPREKETEKETTTRVALSQISALQESMRHALLVYGSNYLKSHIKDDWLSIVAAHPDLYKKLIMALDKQIKEEVKAERELKKDKKIEETEKILHVNFLKMIQEIKDKNTTGP